MLKFFTFTNIVSLEKSEKTDFHLFIGRFGVSPQYCLDLSLISTHSLPTKAIK